MRRLKSRRVKQLKGAALLLLAACGGHTPEPVSQPDAVTPVTASFPARTAAGTWAMRADLQRQGEAAAARRRRARAQGAQLRLEATPLAVPDPDAASPTQFGATVNLPGYTRAPRGRTAQAAAWWPIPGDSLVVQFNSQQGAAIQLRGLLHGGTINGDIWYVSPRTGATFQLGRFTARRT